MKKRIPLEKAALQVCIDSEKQPRIYQLTPRQGRIKLDEVQDAPVAMYPASVCTVNFDTGRWTKGSDGYWYQNSIIEPGANTPSLFTKVTIQDAKAEQLKTFDVIIYTESVQAEGYSDIWDAFAGVQ